MDQSPLTLYPDVNAVLREFQMRTQTILGRQFKGMYLYGSLALGDFDPQGSDLDLIVVTDGDVDEAQFAALREMHAQFAESGSLWAKRIEAAYIPVSALNHAAPTDGRYPQIEKGGTLVNEPLEIGWAFQRETLREYGVVLMGPEPRTLIDPVDPKNLRRAMMAIAGGWLDQARHDPDWLVWVRQRDAQAFVVLTLCRFLYWLDSGRLASKPAAGRWAQTVLEAGWTEWIERSLAGQHDDTGTPDSDVEATIRLVEYVVERGAS